MKKLAISAVITALVSFSASGAATFPQGLQEVLFEGSFNLENHKGSTRADVTAGYGYFIADNLEVGILGSFRKTEWDSEWGINSVWGFGVFGEYNFETSRPLIPYLGARLALLDGNESSDTAVNGTAIAGVKLMLTRSAALAVSLFYDVSSEDIYVINRKPDNSNLTGKAGFRVFF